MKKATRLPEDWTLPENYRAWALTLLDDATIQWEADKFADYWWSCPGQRGVKLNWLATWRNWCRRVYEQQSVSRGTKRQTWQLSDDELLQVAHERGVASRGMTRQQLIAAVEARQ